MKPDNLKENINIGDMSATQMYEKIHSAAERYATEVAASQSKPDADISYGQLIEEAELLSRNIPFDEHPIEIDMEPGIGTIVAIVAALKKGCRPVSNDRESRVKLIINDNIVRITGKATRHNVFMQYVVKSIASSRPQLLFEHRRQLKRQDFINNIILTLMKGGKILIKN